MRIICEKRETRRNSVHECARNTLHNTRIPACRSISQLVDTSVLVAYVVTRHAVVARGREVARKLRVAILLLPRTRPLLSSVCLSLGCGYVGVPGGTFVRRRGKETGAVVDGARDGRE